MTLLAGGRSPQWVFFKCNLDAALLQDAGKCGQVHHEVSCLPNRFAPWALFSPMEVEALALYATIKWVIDLNLTHVIF